MTSKQNHATLLYGFPRNTEVTEKSVNVEEALSRVQDANKSIQVTLEVYGFYALPDSWKQKVVSYRFIYPHLNLKIGRKRARILI